MGYKVVLESTIMQKGKPATAGSKMLENFISPIDATVVTRLESAGADIICRAEIDEFGLRGLLGRTRCQEDITQETVKDQATDTALDTTLTEAVSDSGATLATAKGATATLATANSTTATLATTKGAYNLLNAICDVAEGKVDFVLCNDYNGAVSSVAVAQGVCYIHPPYGTVSRYGLIPSVTSMDQIGIVCKTPEEGLKALGLIKGYDPKDGTMSPNDASAVKPNDAAAVKPNDAAAVNSQDTSIAAKPQELSKEIKITEIEPEYSEVFTQIMQILCCAELSNNISRYDGIKYGHRAKDYNGLDELYKKSRTEAFGSEAKLAAILGAMVLSQENYTRYYDKAMRLRRLIRDSLEFEKYDVIKTKSPELSRLCGLPALTTPEGTYIANAGREAVEILYKVAGTANGVARTASGIEEIASEDSKPDSKATKAQGGGS